jgi:streptomycin 6-kinase
VRRLHIPLYLGDVAAREGRDDLRDWVASLPAVVSELTERWALQLGAPYEPGGQCSWVAPARNRSGEDLVLKVGWRHSEAANEADGLRYWRDDGTVRLHAAEVIDQTSALLLERCDPGTPLGRSMPEPEQDVVVAGLLRRLWTQPPDGHPFRPLQTMCEEWAGEFEHGFMGSSRGIDPGLAREAMVLFRELPSSAGRTVLLCTDLHGENILAARREPWLVIDPKPYVGDPTYDPLQHMLNCEERLTADPLGFARRIAALLDLDAERLRLWLFARCMQECLDQPVLYDIAARLAPK